MDGFLNKTVGIMDDAGEQRDMDVPSANHKGKAGQDNRLAPTRAAFSLVTFSWPRKRK
ncbi:MAG: hypothetical protein OEZ39_17710 [Gammaproteobacteria bacterium]|nr:hypothetical protein [Gammaproteobacteria bacterium]MDH5653702.1 hypothetical protein [Gammaproteobacteria bacterium]